MSIRDLSDHGVKITDVNTLVDTGSKIGDVWKNVTNVASGGEVTQKLGSAIETFAKDGLSSVFETGTFNTDTLKDFGKNILNDVFDVKKLLGITKKVNDNVFDYAKYASDFVPYAPKPKFLFKVFFELDPQFARLGGANKEYFHLVKAISRPKMNFEYEDVNIYNYRTKVLRKMTYDPITITFYDDSRNRVMQFMETYRKAMSPGANVSSDTHIDYEKHGMNFSFEDGNNQTANTGNIFFAEDTTIKNLIKSITLYQIFGHGSFVTKFVFINPRIESIEYDDLDYESNDGCMVNLGLSYDLLEIKTEKTFENISQHMMSFGASDILGNISGNRVIFKNSSTDDDFNIDGENFKAPAIKNAYGGFLGTLGGGLLGGIDKAINKQIGKTADKLIAKAGIRSTVVNNGLKSIITGGADIVKTGGVTLIGKGIDFVKGKK